MEKMQFSHEPGRCTTDTIFIVRQLQGKYFTANRPIHCAFVDCEKPSTVCQGRSCGWPWETLVLISELCVSHDMYSHTQGHHRVSDQYSEEFGMGVGVPKSLFLTHWGRDKMEAISQTIFSIPFSWLKIYEFW